MSTANQLDRRITIRRDGAQTGVNGFNEPVFAPSIVYTVAARRTDVSDGERQAAGTTGAFRVTRFVVRHTPRTAGILPTDKLSHEGRDYNITGTKETQDGRRRFIEITATMAAD